MTRKEYLKAQVDFLKLIINTMLGVLFAISLYNIQTSSANIIIVTISIVMIGLVLIFVYFKVYIKCLNELEKMHKDE